MQTWSIGSLHLLLRACKALGNIQIVEMPNVLQNFALNATQDFGVPSNQHWEDEGLNCSPSMRLCLQGVSGQSTCPPGLSGDIRVV